MSNSTKAGRSHHLGLLVASALVPFATLALPVCAYAQTLGDVAEQGGDDPDQPIAENGDLDTPVQAADNDGTDPTRPVRSLSLTHEHLDLRGGFNSDVTAINFTQPLGSSRNSIRVKVPFASVDALGNRKMALGDIGVRFNWIPYVDRKYGIVVQTEMQFDTAARPELGSGKNVLKSTLIYARFLPDGSILAPALVHSNSLWGQSARRSVRNTTFDLYYVPRLRNPRLYMTIDPAVTVDWERDITFPSLAVTMGYKLGDLLGGKGQISIKPSATFLSDRPTNWGVEVAFQLLSF